MCEVIAHPRRLLPRHFRVRILQLEAYPACGLAVEAILMHESASERLTTGTNP